MPKRGRTGKSDPNQGKDKIQKMDEDPNYDSELESIYNQFFGKEESEPESESPQALEKIREEQIEKLKNLLDSSEENFNLQRYAETGTPILVPQSPPSLTTETPPSATSSSTSPQPATRRSVRMKKPKDQPRN